jgi:geranylgeranylglycerol-phosphate geranylgeranyltransferase
MMHANLPPTDVPGPVLPSPLVDDARPRWRNGRLSAWLTLLRFRTTLSAPALAVVSLQAIKPGSLGHGLRDMIFIAAAAFFTICFMQIINDILDRHSDARHKPHRPIPSGRVTVRAALLAMVVCAVAGLLAAALVSPLTVGVAVLILVLGASYSLWLKNTVLLGNLTIATVSGAVYQLAPASWHTFNSATAEGSVIVFLFILGDELFKTAEDEQGDALNGIRTIATRYGPRTSAAATACCCGLLIAIFAANLADAYGSRLFGALCLAIIGVPTAIAAVLALGATSPAIARAHNWWTISWVPGLVALAFIR